LERLILADPRAVCQAPLHLKVHQARLQKIPQEGERVQIVNVGTHALGALFLDGGKFITQAMTDGFDAVSRHFKGFYFGRYDVRTLDLAEFRKGRGFKVLELNGVTSEATSIYDPANTLRNAWRMLMFQWKIAIEIGAANAQNGAHPVSLLEFFNTLRLARLPSAGGIGQKEYLYCDGDSDNTLYRY
jgi:hypothetical protein